MTFRVTPQHLTIGAAAVGIVGLLPLLAGAAPRVPPAIPLMATALAVAGGAAALAVVAGRGTAPAGEKRDLVARVGLPLAIALAAWSGGLGSPALVLVALAALIGAAGDARRAMAIAGGALVLLAIVQLRSTGTIAIPQAAVATALMTAIAVLPLRLAGRADAQLGEQRARTERLERFLGGSRITPRHLAAQPSSLRHEALQAHRQETDRRQFEAISAYLREVRDLHGAADAVFWRFSPRRDALAAAVWAGGKVESPPALDAELAPLVQWAADERMVQTDDAEGRARFVAAPVVAGDVVVGALSLMSRDGLSSPRERLRAWLPRHADQLNRLFELLEEGRESARERVQIGALLKSVHLFQSHRSVPELAQAICETALQVTAGTRAALVRWRADEHFGSVVGTVGATLPAVGFATTAASLVSQQCLVGLPQVWEDARLVTSSTPVFGEGEPPRALGSVSVSPLKLRDGRVVGAIVVEGDAPLTVLIRDARNITLLAGYAALALENVWEIDLVVHRSRTDQLTGLGNRRHFDDELQRIQTEYVRRKQPCSLVVADVDHFKRVNDEHGHEVGDEVLRRIAAIFKESVREMDICARFGGEEIVVLLPETSHSRALEVAERLRQAIERATFRANAVPFPVTASFGVATFPETVTRWDGFFQAADRALYHAKRDGRNRVSSVALSADSAVG